MSSEQFREQGIQAAKARRIDEARQLLQQALRLNPRDELAWLYLASIATEKKDRLVYLQKVLEINPDSELGRKAVQAMGIDPEQLIALTNQQRGSASPAPPRPAIQRPASLSPAPPPIADDANTVNTADDDYPTETFTGRVPVAERAPVAAAPAASPAASGLPLPPPPDPSAPPGVPIPDINYLEEALIYAEGVARRYTIPTTSEIAWKAKEKGRAGERDILELRLRIAGAVGGVLLVIGLIGGAILAISPEAQATVLGIRTRTPTPSPTLTPTNTPGLTPTPSATLDSTRNPTFTPTPTIPLTLSPVGNINATPRPTSLYLPEPPGRSIIEAALLLETGQITEALPTLAAERLNTSRVFNPNPYYFEARALVANGQLARAEQLIAEAEGRLDEVNADQARRYKPLLDLGQAEIEVQRGIDALAVRNLPAAQAAFRAARERLQAVLAFDTRYARAHVLLARTFALEGNYDQALAVLSQGQLAPGLASDITLILEKGEIHLTEALSTRSANPSAAREDFAQADFQAYLAYFLNPFDENAHDLRIRTALAQGLAGQAVLNALDYLFYHPDNPKALRLLGDARTAEGNFDLALEAYTRALQNVTDDDTRADILISRARLFNQQGRANQAFVDYDAAYALRPAPALRAERMQVAYRAGELTIAAQDAEALLGSGALPDDQVRLIQARVLVDQANGREAAYRQALSLLNNITGLPADQRAIADEYRARAHFGLGNLGDALNAINSAVNTTETASRRYLRARIHEANGQTTQAIRDYEWVLAWDTVYGFDFTPDAESRLRLLLNPPPTPTPTPFPDNDGGENGEETNGDSAP